MLLHRHPTLRVLPQTTVLEPGYGDAVVVRTTAILQIVGAVQPGGCLYPPGPSSRATRTGPALHASDATPLHQSTLLRTVTRMQAGTRAAESIP